NSVYPQELPLVGGRPFWIYRSILVTDSDEQWSRMFNAAFEVLTEEFEETGAGPAGVCVVVADRAEMGRRPEVVWPDTDLMFAGYLDNDRQVRIRYFWGAAIAPGLPNSPSIDETRGHLYPLEDRYRIQPLTETGEISADDVLRLWARAGAVPLAEAQRRVHEVQLVASERDEGVVGVSSVYLQRNAQLRMDLWYYRTYVASAHRHSNLAAQLIFGNRDLVEERFVSGEDTRAAGIVFELENEGLKKYFNKALWLPADFTFIGENQRGDHVRVHFFPGARAPVPGH
ncbi:MAG TPA: hypothetical protein VEL05_07050, partial [Candidatus Acidoferrum sp.]|nr:hypothetical protein [Candidatus Acidoferrum sp.]